MSVSDATSGEWWETIANLAETDPLAHPLAFQLGCMEYEHLPPNHLVEIHCALYEALAGDGVRKLARIMPREHGKSEVGAHIVPVWAALRNPNITILLMSHNEQEAKAKLKMCAETLRELAPKFGYGEFKTDNALELTLPRTEDHSEPTIRAAGMKSGVTGGHYHCLIFDDMVDWDMQRTEDRREKYVSKFDDYQNLGRSGDSTFLVLGTRKHPDDIYSHIIQNNMWDTVVAQAIEDWSVIENKEYDKLTTEGGRYGGDEPVPADATVEEIDPNRDVDVLWPERWPLNNLIHEYLSTSEGGLVWKRENQNDAHALMGQVLSEEMLTFVDDLPAGKSVEDLIVYVGVDLGLEEDAEKAASNDSDYWAVATLGLDPTTDTFYMLDITRRRGMSVKAAVEWLDAVLAPYQSRNIYVESNQGQRFFAQTALDEGLHVTETQMQGEKEDRILTMSSRFENGTVRIPRSDAGPSSRKLEAFMTEWAQFPTGEHDDLLDACAHALHGRGDEDEERKKTAVTPFV